MGTGIVFISMLGILVLGPKRLPVFLGQIARAKAGLEKMTNEFKSQLQDEFEERERSDSACSEQPVAKD
jgi:Sec-independent protein translocase protein TatA